MRSLRNPDFDVISQPEDEPIVMAGPPEALYGEVPFHNPGPDRVILRGAQVRSTAMETHPGRQEAEPQPALAFALAPIVLRPGQRRSQPIQVSLNPHTPPGEYTAQLEIAGRVRDVVIHIAESVSLDISPTPVILENRPGERQVKRVVFINTGNLPLKIGEIGAIALDDEQFQCRMLRAALAAAGEETHSLEEYVAIIARQSQEILKQAGVLGVHNTAGEFELQPGEVRPVDLEIRIPAGLEKRSRYIGVAPIYTADLEFVIVPAQGTPPASEPTKEEPKPRKRRSAGKGEEGDETQ